MQGGEAMGLCRSPSYSKGSGGFERVQHNALMFHSPAPGREGGSYAEETGREVCIC